MKITTNFTCDVAGASTNCGSDHSPVMSELHLKQQKSNSERPIPKWLAYHPTYRDTLDKMLSNFDPESYVDPFNAFETIKRTMRKASKMAMETIMAKDTKAPEVRMQFVLQASRAIAYNLAAVALHVKRDFPDLGKYLCVDDHGNVSINNAPEFHKLAQSIAAAQTDTEERQNNDGNARPKGGRAAQLARWSQLWSPFGRRSINVSIVREDGSIAEAAADKADKLRKFWGQVFAEKKISIDEAEEFLNKFAVELNIPGEAIPTTASIKAFLKKAKHSAPCPDGIPYRCWLAAGDKGATTLFLAMLAMMAGKTPPQGIQPQSWHLLA